MPYSPRTLVGAAAMALLMLAGAFIVARGGLPLPGAGQTADSGEQWVCPMHPDVQQRHEGRCPICGMALEKVPASEQKAAHQEAHGARAAATNPSRPSVTPPPSAAEPERRAPVLLDGRRQQLIGVRTVAVTEQALTHRLRAQGIVRFDESRWTDVNVRAEGWIRRLHVDRTGVAVRRGQPLLALVQPGARGGAGRVRPRAADARCHSRRDTSRRTGRAPDRGRPVAPRAMGRARRTPRLPRRSPRGGAARHLPLSRVGPRHGEACGRWSPGHAR